MTQEIPHSGSVFGVLSIVSRFSTTLVIWIRLRFTESAPLMTKRVISRGLAPTDQQRNPTTTRGFGGSIFWFVCILCPDVTCSWSWHTCWAFGCQQVALPNRHRPFGRSFYLVIAHGCVSLAVVGSSWPAGRLGLAGKNPSTHRGGRPTVLVVGRFIASYCQHSWIGHSGLELARTRQDNPPII